jgi:hypothetical protein
VVRALTSGWNNGSIFSVKAGTTTLGGRGTDFIVSRDQVAGTEAVYVNDGLVDVASATTGETGTAVAGESLRVTNGVVGEAEIFPPSEWEAAVFEQGLDFGGTYRAEPDLALFNPTSGEWHVRYQNGITDRFYYGAPGDTPLMGDWDCDGIDTVAMYRESTGFVYYRNSNDFGLADGEFYFGAPGDIPIAGDWNHDGCDTFGIYRNGKVFYRNKLSTGFAALAYWFGAPGDVPFAGDFNGDGWDTVGLYRPSTGFVYFTNAIPAHNSVAPTNAGFYYGIPGDRVIAGDWDGDRDDTVGIFRGSDQTFYLSLENELGKADVTVTTGKAAWLPVAGSFGPGPASPGDTKDCVDFPTQLAAQTWYDYYLPGFGDVAHIDIDGDGMACEHLP